MRILALETTDKTGSVAALDNYNLLAELMLDQNQRSARSLAPAMQALLVRVDWSPKDVQLVGVSIGPGSFTGLRVGVTAAKVFAYAVGADVLGINTLEAIALGGAADLSESGAIKRNVAVAIDAQRGDVVAQPFAMHSPDRVESLGPQELLPADQWLSRLTPETVVSGPALLRLADRLPSGIKAMDRRYWPPQSSAVGRLAAQYYSAGRRDDLWKLVPHYCRRSAAEEKWDAMGK
ncbi:MAG: tRNA (adenosine(37)-N6)-threonylcarbamoyltransferase complex dimerization subunit type 1 TsaB [Planctomycetes bacterium]|nr:tRNA (adenosine(37)-N6)-threonylcarbamoyltransferase complex dimerization subunit type 1 TsaB [Planctomycetota bacterium]MBU4398161.1 tRNA (adenosine(37)-N6)-threonylcarbamoyltransferase complex dimerization subunit type 1 TsaB [Planctomycetota bacterium]MCG2685646.1 tRNA (adenosine(37)-N6)-threonylcarbamoyltransferase complex dimerization subunit type 1 TsaB [Planctomycetales bacterium]